MPSIFKNKEKRKGMTLIELLVVVTMIFIITGVTWVNFRRFGRSFDIERDIGRMAQEVRASLAMTMTMEDRDIPAGCTGSETIVSYGVNFRAATSSYDRMVYFIEGDSTHANFGRVITRLVNNIPTPCLEVVERINLEQGSISLIRVFSGESSSSTSGIDIIFTPPQPRTYIGGIVVHTVGTERRWRSQHDAAEISIFLPETGVTRRAIRVNRAGMIEIIRPGP